MGGNHGESLFDIAHRFKRVIVFECNPILFEALRHRFRRFKNVEIYKFAASNRYGTADLTIPDNGNFFGSGTLLGFADEYKIKKLGNFAVETINLGEYLNLIGVDSIDTYVSDIEGSDYSALQTLSNLISRGGIKKLQIEVWSEKIPRPFKDQNEKIYEEDFQAILGSRYVKIREGTSSLKHKSWKSVENWNSKDILWEFK